jgi:hypothetical protein
LLVEHVRIFSKFRRELSDDERKLYREIKAQFEDSMWELQKTEYAEDDFFRRLIVDLHDSNVGFRGTQPLMIDFSIP